jgi:hypothetical protein
MEFMLLFVDRERGEPAGRAELKQLAGELASAGKLRTAVRLRPAGEGARVRVRDGNALVSDGPYAESQEVVGGFWILEAASRDEAIALARRAFETGEPRPAERQAQVEVHPLSLGRGRYSDSGRGTPFLLAFRMEPGLVPTPEKMQEMTEFGDALVRRGILVETAPLTGSPPPARIVTRGVKTLVTDGPFAETKEAIGGYSLVRVADRAAAIELTKRYPHARWGPVEVREIASLELG